MPSKVIIPENTKFGRLTVLGEAENIGKQAAWLCQCECGNQIVVRSSDLRNGRTTSCGCFHKERTKECNTTHGMQNTPEYDIWQHMKARCFNPKDKAFKNYGGRNITVCDEWKNSFGTFYSDMGLRPEGTSLDRIDNNGNYEPTNCRWSTDIEQARNKRNNHLVTYEGEIKTLAEWAESLNINYFVLHARINKLNWPIERAFTEPVQTRT